MLSRAITPKRTGRNWLASPCRPVDPDRHAGVQQQCARSDPVRVRARQGRHDRPGQPVSGHPQSKATSTRRTVRSSSASPTTGVYPTIPPTFTILIDGEPDDGHLYGASTNKTGGWVYRPGPDRDRDAGLQRHPRRQRDDGGRALGRLERDPPQRRHLRRRGLERRLRRRSRRDPDTK